MNSPSMAFECALIGRRVLITGHTGFKGCWLAHWLVALGADVYGIALAPETSPDMFTVTRLEPLITHVLQDIRHRDAVVEQIVTIDPEVVFHLAAQPLVRRSYDQPLTTFETNTLGTAYVLEACRRAASTKAVVCVTTDKVYDNREWVWAYRETDALGGKDPYSASKAAAEIVAASYAHSFASAGKGLATARGGNVVGGGDWSEDRLIPDMVRAISCGQDLVVRNVGASRPWQHVLALCHGYLQLAAGLLVDPEHYRGAWNFGPEGSDSITVAEVLRRFGQAWTLPNIEERPASDKPESGRLAVDSSKARHDLGWTPAWGLDDAIATTAEWYQASYTTPSDVQALTRRQIHDYRTALAARGEQMSDT